MPTRIASVGYVNARPLIAGLDGDASVQLRLDVPSKLVGLLQTDQADVALLPVIDYARYPGLKLIPAGGIGCDGPTMTVRLFSQTPMEKATTLAVDPDSHTSVGLARIIFRKRFGVDPKLIDLNAATGQPGEVLLLIGDKVVCEEPVGFEHQLDLGLAWKQLTGMPFVFAVWCAKQNVDHPALFKQLKSARERGMNDLQKIVKKYAEPRGWPAGVAMQYLSVYLKFDIGPRQLDAIAHYHQLAHEVGVLTNAPAGLDVFSTSTGSAAAPGLWGED
jgi:chorismate dehydratase